MTVHLFDKNIEEGTLAVYRIKKADQMACPSSIELV
jgi:hypothetical protein